jgi:hypothetical protein
VPSALLVLHALIHGTLDRSSQSTNAASMRSHRQCCDPRWIGAHGISSLTSSGERPETGLAGSYWSRLDCHSREYRLGRHGLSSHDEDEEKPVDQFVRQPRECRLLMRTGDCIQSGWNA